MPKQVDHESRRRHIADAVCGLIGRAGIEAATLRQVAAEAGVSMGAVQRCFNTRQQMLIFAQDHVNRRVTERAQERIAASADPESVVTMLEQTLRAMLVVDDPELVDARVWVAFSAQAAVDPVIAAAQRAQQRGLAELLELLVRVGQDSGRIRPEIVPAHAAEELIALTDGLTLHVLIGHHTPESASTILRRRTAGLWTCTPPVPADHPKR
ncbi:TetR/AcrR family transcriptional regulator [Nocardia acidivorans]|uniref:TetR/AcrR family transcriptional regulator n=1 Tax=Nocardia acidivorans TaxID=404580 RepID=UPI000835CE30|nr:TetR family transcriptional regulator C-terminal domain-containing protein [Nocardia acidivorans]